MGRRLLANRVLPIVLVVLGNLMYAATVKFFLIPANLISSGTTGIALALEHAFGVTLTGFIFVFNVAMLLLALVVFGKKMFFTSILSSLLYPVFLEMLDRLFADMIITDNLLLNTIFAGFGIGLSLGTVLRQGASTGGVDIPLLTIERYLGIKYNMAAYTVDFIIMLSQMFFHRLEDLLYGVLLLVVTNWALNQALLFGKTKTEIKIMSKKADELCAQILTDVERGVTLLHGQGGYTGEETEVLLTVVSNREVQKIRRLVREVDPNCFMTISRVTEVIGEGFTRE